MDVILRCPSDQVPGSVTAESNSPADLRLQPQLLLGLGKRIDDSGCVPNRQVTWPQLLWSIVGKIWVGVDCLLCANVILSRHTHRWVTCSFH